MSGQGGSSDGLARDLADRLLRGERRAIARAISHVEDGTHTGRRLLDIIFPRTGRARRIGVTGPPGSGKSTLVNALAGCLRERGERVGVLAIDPTSPFTGGAILGDRIRMPRACGDEGLFVRSMASRGSLGGIAASTWEATEVLEAAGFEWVIVETVGVGQSELEVVELADTNVLVLVPESGDSVQVMKAGIMEIADVFVVNKYDREGGDRLIRDIEVTMEVTGWSRDGWRPPVCPTVAVRGEGVDALLQRIEQHLEWLGGDEEALGRVRRSKLRRRMKALLERAVLEDAWSRSRLDEKLEEALDSIARREISPYAWVESVLGEVETPGS